MARLVKSPDQWIHLGAGHCLRINHTGGRHFSLLDLRPAGQFSSSAKAKEFPVTIHVHVPLNKTQTEMLFVKLLTAAGWEAEAHPAWGELQTKQAFLRVRRHDLDVELGVRFGNGPHAFAWVFARLPLRAVAKGCRELAPVLGWDLQ